MPLYKAILFDLWDTLAQIVDIDNLTKNTKEILGNTRYVKLKEHFIAWHADDRTKSIFIEDICQDLSLSPNEIQVVEKFIHPRNYEKFPETDDVLSFLKKQDLKIILVTNSPPTSKEAFQNMNLGQFFDATIFSCDAGILKPNKLIFQKALKEFSIQPKEALMVGDSLKKDIQGASHAGLNGLLLDRENTSFYKEKITDLRELLVLIKK